MKILENKNVGNYLMVSSLNDYRMFYLFIYLFTVPLMSDHESFGADFHVQRTKREVNLY